MMKRLTLVSALLWFVLSCSGQAHRKDTVIYLFPGQGADYRQFRDLQIPVGYDTVHMTYPVPEKHETLPEYAHRFIHFIDRGSPYVLMGVSLGGMICTELTDTLEPQQTILISSAKSSDELPGRYTFQKKIPLNRLIPKRLTKGGARMLQGIVEPDRRYDKETFKDMLRRKDPSYLKRTADMIVSWDRSSYSNEIIHIHGDNDHTIPVKYVTPNFLIREGSHLMVLTRAGEISEILSEILN